MIRRTGRPSRSAVTRVAELVDEDRQRRAAPRRRRRRGRPRRPPMPGHPRRHGGREDHGDDDGRDQPGSAEAYTGIPATEPQPLAGLRPGGRSARLLGLASHASMLGAPPRPPARLSDGWRTVACHDQARRTRRPHGPSLSPSRAGDFMTCPLLYRFRVIDRLPEPPSPAATRGTVVHAVLERLFDLPAAERTPEAARGAGRAGVAAAARGRARSWQRLFAESETRRAAAQVAEWLAGAERPARRVLPAGGPDAGWSRPSASCTSTTALDVGPGAARLRRPARRRPRAATCGSSTTRPARRPAEGFEGKALFQMRFYALVLWRMHGRVPRMLQLLYLGQRRGLRYEPDEATCARPSARSRRSGGHRPRPRDRRLAAQPVPAVRLVRPPGALPGVGRHPSPAAGRDGPGGRGGRRGRRGADAVDPGRRGLRPGSAQGAPGGLGPPAP